jgi:hypothetical protein
MIPALLAATLLVIATVLIHYEALRFTFDRLRTIRLPPRPRILIVIVAVFAAHVVEIWLYGLAYWLSIDAFGLGGFGGQPVAGFEDSLYFSAVTYTSLGFGDYYPTRNLRLIAAAEALNGLVLIGWSASFTYVAMVTYWPLHRDVRRHGRSAQATESVGPRAVPDHADDAVLPYRGPERRATGKRR